MQSPLQTTESTAPESDLPGESPAVSIVVPVFEEEESLPELIGSIASAMAAGDSSRSWEIIAIDDGSRDRSLEILKELRGSHPQLRIISFRRNFGQTAAMAAGFDHARGEVIVTLDADLQNDPADIHMLLDKMDEGYDLVSGWRKFRKDPYWSRRFPSKIANGLISRVTGVKLNDYGCTLKAYRRSAIEGLSLFGDMHRFLPALASWEGVRLVEVPVNHRERKFGRSKYGIMRTFRVMLDLLTVQFLVNYRSRPLQLFGPAGLISMGAGFSYGLLLTFQRLFFDVYIRPLRPLIVVLLILTGIQLISTGLIGEMIMRVYFEGQNKPIYTIRERIG